MIIGILTVSISIPDSHSLKDKRMVLRSLKDRVRNAMNVSVGEVGKQDVWQLSELAFATVAADQATVDARLAELDRFLRSDPRYVLLNAHTEMLGE